MQPPKRYLVTSALPYANGPLHIGHLAGAYLSADIYVRFLRLQGKDVLFVCGSDEHGAAITIKAKKEGISPKEVVDKYHTLFEDTFKKIGMSFDIYHRTSAELHHETSQEIFRALNDKGEFELKTSQQYYDEEANQFLADRYITGTCPNCSHEEAYGDQCENCGATLSPTELIDPKSAITGAKPILKETSHWYLPLDKYEAWLKEWVETGVVDGETLHDPSDWKNHVLGQCKSWLDNGLQGRAMTRDLDWGIDVPQELEGAEGKKLYVWMDAPIGYISATKQWAIDNDKDWKPYWQDNETSLIHFIGKDNIVFHCLIFPAILKAHGDYILPVNVPANQFLNLEGKKISTSKNWAIWVHEYLEEMPGMEDELRYFMMKSMPESRDSEFTWKAFQEANNNELVNNLANFINRVLVLTKKYYESEVPEFHEDEVLASAQNASDESYHDSELLGLFDKLDEMRSFIHKFEFRAALKCMMEISALGNQFLQFNEPWKTIKEDPENVQAVMNLALQYVTALSVVMKPFLPFTSDKLRNMLNLPEVGDGSYLVMMNELAEGTLILEQGHKLNESAHLFSRIDDSVIQKQLDKLQATAPVAAAAAVTNTTEENTNGGLKSTISYDDFQKLDIRTAKIVAAKKVEGADKLLELTVDLGFEQRTVVSGIAKQFPPDDLKGKKILLLANLAPRKIRGVESNGMILLAEDGSGNLSFVQPEGEFGNGFEVR